MDSSLLASLPAELRLSIYEYALVEDNPIILTHDGRTAHGLYAIKHKNRQTALLKTCKEIRNEALPILLGKNTFKIKPMYLERLTYGSGEGYGYAYMRAGVKETTNWIATFGDYAENLSQLEFEISVVPKAKVEWLKNEIKKFQVLRRDKLDLKIIVAVKDPRCSRPGDPRINPDLRVDLNLGDYEAVREGMEEAIGKLEASVRGRIRGHAVLANPVNEQRKLVQRLVGRLRGDPGWMWASEDVENGL